MWNVGISVEHNFNAKLYLFSDKGLLQCDFKNLKLCLNAVVKLVFDTAVSFSLSDLRPREVWPDVWKHGSHKGQHVQTACKYSHFRSKVTAMTQIGPYAKVLVGFTSPFLLATKFTMVLKESVHSNFVVHTTQCATAVNLGMDKMLSPVFTVSSC